MNPLATMKHADSCQVMRENGIAVWMCVGSCPAMAEFIVSGQVDDQPWDQRRWSTDAWEHRGSGASAEDSR